MPIAEVFPFADVGEPGSFPAWIRGLRHESGVYIIRDLFENAIGYVGESHSNRLYSTLTRHLDPCRRCPHSRHVCGRLGGWAGRGDRS